MPSPKDSGTRATLAGILGALVERCKDAGFVALTNEGRYLLDSMDHTEDRAKHYGKILDWNRRAENALSKYQG